MPYARLDDRAILTVSGEQAAEFLQNLITADLDALAESEARPAALLTPQGKILFDFLVSRSPEGLRLDCALAARGDLLKRLTLYRLRSKVSLAAEDLPVLALWDIPSHPAEALVDRRFPGGEVLRLYGSPPEGVDSAPAGEFEAARIAGGIAEAEKDFPAADVFPHDVLLDQNGGVSFTKGCYVGQEVVSRMQHRKTARRRVVLLQGERPFARGAVVLGGKAPIGTVLASNGEEGMALVRIDRLSRALAADEPVTADGVPVDASIPAWAGYTLPAASEAEGTSGEDT